MVYEETDDKQLMSLRQQKQRMDEREEKKRLKEELKRRAMAEDRKVFSTGMAKEGRTILSKDKQRKEKRFMSAKNSIFS